MSGMCLQPGDNRLHAAGGVPAVSACAQADRIAAWPTRGIAADTTSGGEPALLIQYPLLPGSNNLHSQRRARPRDA